MSEEAQGRREEGRGGGWRDQASWRDREKVSLVTEALRVLEGGRRG